MRIPIPVNLIDDTCKIGQGEEQCMYLARQEDADNYFCCKTDQNLREIIKGEVDSFLRRFRDNNKTQHGLPIGDNCPGYRAT